MPVHAHDGAEGLNPEWIGEPTQQFVASIMMHDRLAHDRAETCHAVGEPFRNLPAMQREVRAPHPSSHEFTSLQLWWIDKSRRSCFVPRWVSRGKCGNEPENRGS